MLDVRYILRPIVVGALLASLGGCLFQPTGDVFDNLALENNFAGNGGSYDGSGDCGEDGCPGPEFVERVSHQSCTDGQGQRHDGMGSVLRHYKREIPSFREYYRFYESRCADVDDFEVVETTSVVNLFFSRTVLFRGKIFYEALDENWSPQIDPIPGPGAVGPSSGRQAWIWCRVARPGADTVNIVVLDDGRAIVMLARETQSYAEGRYSALLAMSREDVGTRHVFAHTGSGTLRFWVDSVSAGDGPTPYPGMLVANIDGERITESMGCAVQDDLSD